MPFIFRSLWLKVTDFLYFALLFGGLIALVVSTGIVIHGIVLKKDKKKFKSWIITILISLILVILTMTGKIAPYCAFGG